MGREFGRVPQLYELYIQMPAALAMEDTMWSMVVPLLMDSGSWKPSRVPHGGNSRRLGRYLSQLLKNFLTKGSVSLQITKMW